MDKKTIWNASLENSLNLITKKYIETSMQDVKEKGYKKKILGFLFMNLMMLIFYGIGIYIDGQSNAYGIQIRNILLIFFVLSLFVTAGYIFELRNVKKLRVLNYYYFNKWIAYIFVIFLFSTLLLIGTGFLQMVDLWVSIVLFAVLPLFGLIERIAWFRRRTYRMLYQNKEEENKIYEYTMLFVGIASKFGGVLFLLIHIARRFLSSATDGATEDMSKTVVTYLSPLLFVGMEYVVAAIVANNFQGYYIHKYPEEYRELYGYSKEEWYGKNANQ